MNLIFRVNGNSEIGYGHLIRCVALAEILKSDYRIKFVCSAPNDFVRSQVSNLAELIELPVIPQFSTEDARSEEEIGFDLQGIISENDVVILDGYRFGTRYRTRVREVGAKLVCIEDYPNGYYPVNLIISSNPTFSITDFHTSSDTHFCLGLQSALLRSPFRKRMKSGESRNGGILIAMGGSDYYQLTPKMIEGLMATSISEITAIYTAGFDDSNIARITALHKSNPHRVRLYHDINADNLAAIMDRTTAAILPASGILVEALSRKVKIFAGFYAFNQINFYDWLVKNRYVYPLGDLRELSDLSKITDTDDVVSDFNLTLRTDSQWKEVFRLYFETT